MGCFAMAQQQIAHVITHRCQTLTHIIAHDQIAQVGTTCGIALFAEAGTREL